MQRNGFAWVMERIPGSCIHIRHPLDMDPDTRDLESDPNLLKIKRAKFSIKKNYDKII